MIYTEAVGTYHLQGPAAVKASWGVDNREADTKCFGFCNCSEMHFARLSPNTMQHL